MSDVSFLGSFRGAELRPEQLDGILAFSLSRKDLDDGRGFYASKWWDYRFVHPGHSFFLFAHHYREAVIRWRTMFGVSPFLRLRYEDHPIWRIEDGKRVASPQAYRTSLWRAMCFADSAGISYDRWINWAFELAFEEKWQRLPTPAGLTGVRTIQAILARWEDETTALMAVPKDPRYLSANFVGDPTQIEFQKWLLGLIKRRPNQAIALKNFLTVEPYANPDMARTVLGEHVVVDALRRITAVV